MIAYEEAQCTFNSNRTIFRRTYNQPSSSITGLHYRIQLIPSYHNHNADTWLIHQLILSPPQDKGKRNTIPVGSEYVEED